MKKVLGASLAVLVILLGVPLAAAVMVSMGVGAATECTSQALRPFTGTVPVEGPVGGPVAGDIVVAQANIPDRVGMAGFNASMPRVLSTRPDFVSLNEMAGRSLAQIEAAAPGYAAYREPDAVPGSSARESVSNVVAWRTDTWTRVGGGRVTLVEGDRGFYEGRPILGDRFVTWTMLQRSDGAVVSMLSTHHMINPHKYPRQHGNPPLTRAEQYGQGMDTLIGLSTSLAAHGPVLVAGDMNTHATYTDLPWSAVAKMSAAGYGWHSAAVDFIFYQRQLGVTLTQGWSGPMQSDHPWVAAKFAMNGVGPTNGPAATTAAGAGLIVETALQTASTIGSGDVLSQLTALTPGPGLPQLTTEQAGNVLEIARVAHDLQVPRLGLQVALATAIQESTLRNLDEGHADSAGLFQQRPSTGWGTRAQVTDPALAAQAFFGQAAHTDNPGLLDVAGWEQLPLAEAAARVQRPRDDLRGAYARWETVAGDMADIVGGELTAITPTSTSTGECSPTGAGVAVATFNLLGAGHTDKNGGGAATRNGFPSWEKRLPGAMAALQSAGVSIAALQEVHPPQVKALAGDYAASWSMFPLDGDAQNRVIWDNAAWTLTTGQLVQIPYFDGEEVGMPLVQLTSTTTGQSIWVWSIHNPADTRGNAADLRAEALRRQHATLSDLAAAGTPGVIAGDFNDARDGDGSSHCQLTPTLTNAFGGSADSCTKPTEDAAVDHIYGANLSWASARVDSSVQAAKLSDHPLVVATTAGNSTACTMQPAGYNLGPVQPQLARLVGILGPMFDIQTVGGYRESAHDPNGHPSDAAPSATHG